MIWTALGLSTKQARHARRPAKKAPSLPADKNGKVTGMAAADVAPVAGAESGLLARSGSLSLVGMASSVTLGFVFVLVVTRLDHTQRAGALFEAIAAFTILENVTELGADTGLLRILPRYRVAGAAQDLRSLFTVSLVPSVLAAVLAGGLLWAFAPQFAHLFVHHGPLGRTANLFRAGRALSSRSPP